MPTTELSSAPSSGARLVDTEGRVLPLRGTRLDVRAGAGLARARLEQTFRNVHAEPLRVRYLLPLPADGAVVGFAFVLEGERTRGRVEPRKKAREDFERALIEGRSAALLEEDRSSLFTQEIGNLPPGAELTVEVEVDQPLAWLPEGAWAFRFPTVVGPRYLGAPGRTPDADRVTVDVAGGEVDARAELALHVEDARTGPVRSPSHALDAEDAARVRFADPEGARLDRDIVIEWPVATPEPGASLSAGRPPERHPQADHAFGQLTLVPPSQPKAPVPRDLVFLVDVSGSMHGEPLEQAKRCLLALVDRLEPRDRLEMVAFANRPERWRRRPVAMDADGRGAAARWLRELTSGGATEMYEGIEAALSTLRDGALRQVVVVTDGFVGFEAEIVAAVKGGLPRACRVHTLGVSSSVNRSLTSPLARVGGGLELIVAPGEDAERAAPRLLAATDQPQVAELELSGDALSEAATATLPELMAGAPARLPLRLRPEGGRLRAAGRTADGPWSTEVEVPALAPGEGAAAPIAAFARARVEDLEAARAALGAEVEALDGSIEQLGVEFQIATRLTSWVAVRAAATVDPQAPSRAEVMPHLLPRGVSAEGIGLRAAASPLIEDAEDLEDWLEDEGGRPPSHALDLFVSRPPPMSGGPLEDADPPRSRGPLGRLFGGPKKARGRAGRRARPAATSGAEPPRLTARVRIAEPGWLVLDVETEGPLAWAPAHTAQLVREDGSLEPAAVDSSTTTRAGDVPAGGTFRLALRTGMIPALIRVGDLEIEVLDG